MEIFVKYNRRRVRSSWYNRNYKMETNELKSKIVPPNGYYLKTKNRESYQCSAIDNITDTYCSHLFEYNPAGYLLKETTRSPQGSPINESTYSYDRENTLQVKTFFDDKMKNLLIFRYDYDSLGRMITEYSPLRIHKKWEYCGNHIIETVFEDEATFVNTYMGNPNNQIIQKSTMIDGENCGTKAISYDTQGRIATETFFYAIGSYFYSHEYDYDEMGHQIYERNKMYSFLGKEITLTNWKSVNHSFSKVEMFGGFYSRMLPLEEPEHPSTSKVFRFGLITETYHSLI